MIKRKTQQFYYY